MSFEDKTDARGRLEILAEQLPVDRDHVLIISSMSWGYGGALIGQELGYTYADWFPAVLMGFSIVGMVFVTKVMDA